MTKTCRKFVKQTLCFLIEFYCATHTYTGPSFHFTAFKSNINKEGINQHK